MSPAFFAANAGKCACISLESTVRLGNPKFLAVAVQDFVRGESLRAVYCRRIRQLIVAHPEFSFRRRRCENPSGWIVDTMRAVLQALLETDSYESCIVDVTSRGGDADTTGAIAGMLAGAHYGFDSLPLRWRKALDPAVHQACQDQARALVGCPSVGGK